MAARGAAGFDEGCNGVVPLGRSRGEGALSGRARRALREMDQRLITVLDMRLEQTLAKVGERFGVSRERVAFVNEFWPPGDTEYWPPLRLTDVRFLTS